MPRAILFTDGPPTDYVVGDRVDVHDLRDFSRIEKGVTITGLRQETLPGTTNIQTYATLSCGYAVNVICLRWTSKTEI